MTKTQENILNRARPIIAQHLGVNDGDIQMGKRFEEDFGADSLDMIELVIALEEEFQLEEIDEDAVRRVNTVEDAVLLLEFASKKESANA